MLVLAYHWADFILLMQDLLHAMSFSFHIAVYVIILQNGNDDEGVASILLASQLWYPSILHPCHFFFSSFYF
jgi:hypothetical protein